MLLSRKHQFLFVHVAKTGGSSIRASLAKLRRRDPAFVPSLVCDQLSRLTKHTIGAKLPRHAPAVAAHESLPLSLFDSLFKFAFVRNPWDRLVSAYCHFERERTDILQAQKIHSFNTFVQWITTDGLTYRGPRHTLVHAFARPQHQHFIDLQGNHLLDFVGRYERLSQDFEIVKSFIDASEVSLPHRRRSTRNDDYRRHYCDISADHVARFYEQDIELFGYRFDLQSPDEFSTLSDFRNATWNARPGHGLTPAA